MDEQQIREFNYLYEKATANMKGLLLLDGYRPKSVGFFFKLKLKKAINYFNQALEIYPESWQSLFFLGKIYQRLGEYDKSLFYFEKALKLEHTNHSIPHEASLVAMQLNQIEKSIEYSTEALKRKPDHFIIMGNHAMSLLIAGRDNESKETINKALELDSSDKINHIIKDKIEKVISGKMKRPTFDEFIG